MLIADGKGVTAKGCAELGARAGIVAGFLGAVHGVLYAVLRMESFALLAGTAALFVALAAVMFFTRNIDWHQQEEVAVSR